MKKAKKILLVLFVLVMSSSCDEDSYKNDIQ